MNNKLLISIVIPCCDDIRIKQCIESIDEDVEVIVVLNGSTEDFRLFVKQFKVKIINLPDKSPVKSLNAGIDNSINQYVLTMDSDCVFEKGALREFFNNLDNAEVVKGRVVYLQKGIISSAISKVRDYINYDELKPYNPFVCINKNIKNKIGGYYYNNNIFWTEDADLNLRIKKAKIIPKYIFSSIMYHAPLTMKHDLKGAFKHGIGKRKRVEQKIAFGVNSHFDKVFDVMRKKGILPGTYYFIWNCFYVCGYFCQFLFKYVLLK